MNNKNSIYEIGQRIKIRREAIGMSQQELANRVGYKSRSSINKIELGKNDIVQSTVNKIATALGCSPAYIMFGDGDNFHRILGGWGTSSHLVSVILSDPPSREVVQPLLDYYGENNDEFFTDIKLAYNRLNEQGKEEAIKRVEELAEIPKYKRLSDEGLNSEKKEGT